MSDVPPDPPGFRISDADRERAAARLQKALADGRITLAELEERLSVVYAARYEADLLPPLADLPGAEAAVVPGTAAAPPSTEPLVLRSGMSTIKRTGDWEVPARLRLHTGMGTIVLNFCETQIPHPVVDIEVYADAGTVRLLVPEGVTADVNGVSTQMGTVRSNVASRRRPDAPHFVVHGRCGMGTIVVRHRYQLAGWRF